MTKSKGPAFAFEWEDKRDQQLADRQKDVLKVDILRVAQIDDRTKTCKCFNKNPCPIERRIPIKRQILYRIYNHKLHIWSRNMSNFLVGVNQEP